MRGVKGMFTKLLLSVALSTSLFASENAMAQEKKAATKSAQSKLSKSEQAKQKAAADAAKKKADAEAALKKAEKEKEEKEAAQKAQELADQKAKEATLLGYLKSKFSLSYHGEYLFTRDADNKLKDFSWMHNPTLVYRPLENWRLLVTSEFKYFDSGVKGSYINRHYRSLYSITRENVLTEQDHGVKLDLGVARRVFDQKMSGGKPTSYGNWRLTSSLRKTINPNFTTSLFAQYLRNDPTELGKPKANMWDHSLELIPSFSWQITDKFSWFFNDDIVLNLPRNSGQAVKYDISHEMNIGFWTYQFTDKHSAYFQFKYLHFTGASFQESFQNQMDWFDYYIGHTYQITQKMSFTTEVGSTMFKGGDGRDFFAKDIQYPGVYFYFDFRL